MSNAGTQESVAKAFVNRMIRAAKLDLHLYEEVEADSAATGQAVGVVVLSAVAAGIGTTGAGIGGLLIGSIVALISWYIWAFLTYWIGTRILPEPQTHATQGQLLRTIGFASSPGLLRVLGIIPGLRGIIFFAAGVWMLVAMVFAVKQALDYHSTWRAVGVCIIGWIVQLIVIALLLSFLAGARHPM
jgi:hypothetical protein